MSRAGAAARSGVGRRGLGLLGLLSVLVVTGGEVGASRPEALGPGFQAQAEITPGERHEYEVELNVDDFIHVVIEQKGAGLLPIDLVLSWIEADGQELSFDAPFSLDVPESVAIVSASTGHRRLVVRPFRSADKSGSYRLRVVALRPATLTDRLRATTELRTYDGHRRAAGRTAEDLRSAIEIYMEARQGWALLQDPVAEARIARRLGDLRLRLGDMDAALTDLGAALELDRAAGHEPGAARTLVRLARVYRRQGRGSRAAGLLDKVLDIHRRSGDRSQEARTELELGHCLQGMEQPETAAAHYRRALELFRALDEPLRVAMTAASLGPIQNALGRPDEAVKGLEQALDIFRRLGRPDQVADTLNNLARTRRTLGELHGALEAYGEAEDLYRRLGDSRRWAAVANSQAHLLTTVGRPEQAFSLLSRAREAVEESSDAFLYSRILTNLAVATAVLGRSEAALKTLDDALQIQRRSGDKGGVAWSTFHRARMIRERRNPPPREDLAVAHGLATASLKIFRELGHEDGTGDALRLLADVQAVSGDDDAARASYEAALAMAESSADIDAMVTCRQGLAELDLRRRRPESALPLLLANLDDLESLRARLSGQGLRASHFAVVRGTYEKAVETLMELHRRSPTAGFDRRALEISERARARGLLDAVAPAGAEAAPSARERELRRRLNALAAGGKEAWDSAATVAVIAEYHLLQGRLHGLGPAVEAVPLNFGRPQDWLSPGTVVLELLLGEQRGYGWILSAKAGLHSFELPGRGTVEASARRAHALLSSPGNGAELRRELSRLANWLLAPASRFLKGQERVVVVADGALHLVPFAVLPDPRAAEKPLMVGHEVVHLPSLSVAATATRDRRPRVPSAGRLAVLADPVYTQDDPRLSVRPSPVDAPGSELVRLPWSGQEGETVASLAGPEGILLATGSDVTRDLLLGDRIGRYDMVHFAGHGVLDMRFPELSGLALSRWSREGEVLDSFLRLHEIYGLDWHSRLVVLSGCHTALGPTVRGEGLTGLAQGFLHAGVDQVVAGLWTVRDRAAAELMERFYGHLLDATGPAFESPPAALRLAQKGMWRDRRHRDPYFWASYVVIGAGPLVGEDVKTEKP